MSSSKKIISINPAFLSVGGRNSYYTRKKRTRQKRDNIKHYKMSMKPNTIKKDLLRRIKDYQKKHEDQQQTEQQNNLKQEQSQFRNEFQEAIKSLDNIVKQKRKARTLRSHAAKRNLNQNGGVRNPMVLSHPFLKNKPRLVANPTISQQIGETPILYTQPKSEYKPEPPYGCLKGGKKQTYRQYHHTLKARTLKKQTPLVIEDKPHVSHNENVIKRQEKLDALRTHMNVLSSKYPSVPQKRKRKVHTIKRTYNLGKRGRKVDVLIKNKKTRRRIEKAVKNLERTQINEIKRYLKKKHLIKTGSSAPEYMLRAIYINAMLAGDVYNKNASILVHNYFNKE